MNKVFNQYKNEYAALIIVSLLVFVNMFNLPFFFIDDPNNVANNPFLNPPSLNHILTIWGSSKTPLPQTIWIILKSLFGGNPTIFYIFNYLIHLLNGFLIFHSLQFILQQLHKNVESTIRTRYALLGALLFLIHPLQIQAVSWISELRTILATCFLLIGLLFYNKIITPNKEIHLRNFVIFFITYVLALLSKPIVASFAFFLIIYSLLILKESLKLTFIKNIPIIIFTLLATMLHINDELVINHQVTTPSVKLLTTFFTNIFYLEKIILPHDIQFIYPLNRYNFLQYISDHKILLIGKILFILSISIILLSKKNLKNIFFSFLAFVAIMLPTSGIVDYNYQMSTLVADRYSYLGIFTIALCFSLILIALQTKIKHQQIQAVGFVVIGLLTIQSIRIMYQRIDEKTLLQKAANNNRLFKEIYINYLFAHNDFNTALTALIEQGDIFDIGLSFLQTFQSKVDELTGVDLAPIIERSHPNNQIRFDYFAFKYLVNNQRVLDAYLYFQDQGALLSKQEKAKLNNILTQLAKQKKFDSYLNLGDHYYIKGNTKKAVELYVAAIKMGMKLHNRGRLKIIKDFYTPKKSDPPPKNK